MKCLQHISHLLKGDLENAVEGTTWITEDVLLLYEAQWSRHYTCVNMVREKVINARQKLNNCDYSHNVVINLYSF